MNDKSALACHIRDILSEAQWARRGGFAKVRGRGEGGGKGKGKGKGKMPVILDLHMRWGRGGRKRERLII